MFLFMLLFVCAGWQARAAVSGNITVHKFVSCIDGNLDCYALCVGRSIAKSGVANPSDASGDTLFVYLHGLGGDYNEPFKSTDKSNSSIANAIAKEFPAASFLSLNYGSTPSWGSAAARIDITSNLQAAINELNIKKIILIGNTMGAATALTYAATAPLPIKEKITGIVAVSPCADLEDLYKQSTAAEVKTSLEAVFGAGSNTMPLAYEQNSLVECLPFLSPKIKFGIISATADAVIPFDLQKDVIRDLTNRDMLIKVIEIEGKSEPLPIKQVLELLRFVTA